MIINIARCRRSSPRIRRFLLNHDYPRDKLHASEIQAFINGLLEHLF
jgi:hypothetical protein